MLPGAVVAAVVLEATFQVLPLYLRYSSNVVALKAFGAPALLLVWLYVMANVIVFGAEINWWLSLAPEARGRRAAQVLRSKPCAARARCELRDFQSSPSSATVRSSPSGTKTGS